MLLNNFSLLPCPVDNLKLMLELSPYLSAASRLEGLRKAAPEDDEAIATLWRAAWCSAHPEVTAVDPPDHWLSRVRTDLGSPYLMLVREVAGQIQAFLVLQLEQRYLYQLHVAPAFQSQGQGTRLLQWVCAAFPEGWSLHTATSNWRGRALYERFGLQAGAVDVNPESGRERVIYRWQNSERQCQG